MLAQKDKYWIWQGQKFDIEGKIWSYIGQGHSLDMGWTYCGQSLDMGQCLDKLLMTNIGNQHRIFYRGAQKGLINKIRQDPGRLPNRTLCMEQQ